MAGGQSRRMGTNKALLEVNGQTLVERAIERLHPQVTQLLVSTNVPLELPANIPQLADTLDDAGPLAGVFTGLLWLQKRQRKCSQQRQRQHKQRHQVPPASAWLLTVAVDTPLFPQDLPQQLWEHASTNRDRLKIIAACSGKREHPTFALWHTDLIPALSEYLVEKQQRRLMTFIGQQSHRYVDFSTAQAHLESVGLGAGDPFDNINDPPALLRLAKRLQCERPLTQPVKVPV
ncbi:molybdenum cofactor guanylyltransferase MobA [Pseudomaricurvus hydrocarbonicus]